MIRGIVFDLDGVLYIGDKTVEGAVAAVAGLLELGVGVFYLTNNSGKKRHQIVEKLRRLNFPAELENTYCCAHAVATYLAEQNLSPVYLIGAAGLDAELFERGIKTKDSSDVPAVVVGFDTRLDYNEIAIALRAIDNGAKLIVANTDPWFPAEIGIKMPGCGAMVGAVVGCSQHEPDFVVGKPNTYMLELLCRDYNLSSTEICVVGDSPESDIEMANRFGCDSVLFDPKNSFPEFLGNKIKILTELIRARRTK